MTFVNALVYDSAYKSVKPMDIFTEHGKIARIAPHGDKISGGPIIDLKNHFVLPGFVDSHLHFPGRMLYELFGVNLADAGDIEEYKQLLGDKRLQNGSPVRGYGWYQGAFAKEGVSYREFKEYLDAAFDKIPVGLLSFDCHACLCNQAFLDSVSGLLVQNGDVLPDGLITEKNVFNVLDESHIMRFSDVEITEGILSYQKFLLSRGITSVQSLLFLGASHFREIEIFHKLDSDGRLKINCNLALTVQPGDNLDEVYDTYTSLQKYASSKLKINSVKLYVDGVVENSTALLTQPYENTGNYGVPIWQAQEVLNFCSYFNERKIQIHVHAIGDGAVHLIADVLSKVLKDGDGNPNRHVIAHLQMASDEDLQILGKYKVLCTIQPFWFPTDGTYNQFDIEKIGGRAFMEYKAHSLINRGIPLSFSSDSPVTADPNPLIGVSMAMRHTVKEERLQMAEALDAFLTGGAYQLKRENEIGRLSEGYWADFSVYEEDITKLQPIGLIDVYPCEVYYRGEKVR